MKPLHHLALASAWFFTQSSAADASQAYDLAYKELNAILDLTNNLTNAITAWDGTDLAASLNNIHNPSVSTTSYIADAAVELQQNQATLDNTQSFEIASPSQRLAYAVNASVASLIRRKSSFDALNVGQVVVSDLTALLGASRNFSDALVTFIPDKLRPVAMNIRAQNLDSLQQGISCFNGTESACNPAIVDMERTYNLAVQFNAMNPDGSPYV